MLWLGPDDLPTQHTASSHDVNLPTALRLAATMGLKMPECTILAIEAASVLDFTERLSPEVAEAVPVAVEAVLAEVSQCEDRDVSLEEDV